MPETATQTDLSPAEDAIFCLLGRLRTDRKLADCLAYAGALDKLILAIQPGTGMTVESIREYYLRPCEPRMA